MDTRKTYVIKVSVDLTNVSYAEIEEQLDKLGVDDIDLLEEYND